MPRLLAEEISEKDFEPIEIAWQIEKASSNLVVAKAHSLLPKNTKLAFDSATISATQVIENKISRCRYELTKAEIERYRKLGKDLGQAVGELIENIQQGETEIEIARKIKAALAVYNIAPVVTLVGADERIKKFRHPIPTENRWKKNLLIAVCGKRAGLIANLSRIVCIGAISDDLKRKTEATAYIFAKLLSATNIGADGGELYKIAANAYAERGFGDEINQHHQGGATGYKTRDWLAHPKSSETVQINQAFAWNPSISGTKTEETCIIFENEIEIITASSDYPQIVVEIDGRKYLSPDVLSL